MKKPSAKEVIWQWMDDNYSPDALTIRAVWYDGKRWFQDNLPMIAKNLDKQTSTHIGSWLWAKFCNGYSDIYGSISNSFRVETRSLPIILMTEKNTLKPFGNLPRVIEATIYSSSGETNNYEIANIVKQFSSNWHDEIYVYTVCDFDEAGAKIHKTFIAKLSMFFDVTVKRLEIEDIHQYETYTQPNGVDGLELDAIHDLEDLVREDLESFLPYELFETLALENKKDSVLRDEINSDELLNELYDEMTKRESEIEDRVNAYEFYYCLSSDLDHLADRVEVTK